MIRVLFIARYHDQAMQKKIQCMAQDKELDITCVYPLKWNDAYGSRPVVVLPNHQAKVKQVNIFGNPDDPHRALYQTISFGMMKIRPHIIHAEEEPDSLSALQIVWAKRVFSPYSHIVFNTWQNILRPMRLGVKVVLNTSLSAADAMLCASSEAAQVLKRENFEKPVCVIPPNGVDTEVFKPCHLEKNSSHEPFLLGYLGRFVPEKGLETVLEAMKFLPPHVFFVLAGAGRFKENLQTIALNLGLENRIRFQNPLQPNEVPEWLCSLDALVLPSRTTQVWKEQFGRVLVEAMACGIPVIGSDSGAIPEVIGDAGLIFEEGNSRVLAQSVMSLLDSYDLRKHLSKKGILRIKENFTQEQIARKTCDFYKEVAK